MSGKGTPKPTSTPFGVYVHIPFCVKRCDYCAFATWTDRGHMVDRYVRACVTELQARRPAVATSIYFGGGTPSLLTPDQMAAILASIPATSDAEVTVECNPETVDLAKLEGYRAAGVTRLSFGVQSFDERVLSSLGRLHSAAAVPAAVNHAARAGFGESYNVDLIYGAAGESTADWMDTLEAALALDPPPAHVSAYALTVEAGTPLARQTDRHPDPDDQADKYGIADDLLAAAGLHWYEISNWARPGAECRHNLLYWQQGEYLGIGCSAHSHLVDTTSGTARRSWNVRHIDRYLAQVEQGGIASAGSEILTEESRQAERLQLALRTRLGVPVTCLADDPALAGLVEPAGAGRIRLTRRGRLLANEVSLRLRTASSPAEVG